MRRKGRSSLGRLPCASQDLALALPKTMCGLVDEESTKSLLDGLKEFGLRAFRRLRLSVGQGSRDRSRVELRDKRNKHTYTRTLRDRICNRSRERASEQPPLPSVYQKPYFARLVVKARCPPSSKFFTRSLIFGTSIDPHNSSEMTVRSTPPSITG